jgi:RNA polymerase sigma-70 factor (ECF subfamily)
MVLPLPASYRVREGATLLTGETTLLKRARAYDPTALGELYDRYAPRMYAYIYRRVDDADLAEDLTGELFVRALQAIQNERAWRGPFVAWLYRIAHNLVVDCYRRRPPMPNVPLDQVPLPADGNDPADAVQEAQACDRLRAAVACLTPEQQEVLALRFGEGLTAKEAGQVVNKSTGAVEALQRRALAALRRILASEA